MENKIIKFLEKELILVNTRIHDYKALMGDEHRSVVFSEGYKKALIIALEKIKGNDNES